MKLLDWWRSKTKQVVFADSERTEAMRPKIDMFLKKVLPEDERENIESYFISDEATIHDCSMASPDDWKRNCREAFGVERLDAALKISLWRLVEVVQERSHS